MSTYDAAASDRLLTDWAGYWSKQPDPIEDWDREGQTIAQRAWKLVLNDPYSGALMQAIASNIIGTGLRFASLFQADAADALTLDEMLVRKAIHDALASHDTDKRLDPGLQLSRLWIEMQVLFSGFISGNGYAVRTWNPHRPGCAEHATCWRVLDAGRVGNPDGRSNDPGKLINGIELRDGVPYRLHFKSSDTKRWEYTDFRDADGFPLVIHYAPDRSRAGGVHGFSKFAIMLKLATHVARLTVAHVTGKRVQASHPMSMQTSDPEKAAQTHREMARRGANSAIADASVLFVGKDCDVKFSTIAYQGADFDQFIKTSLMAFCAAVGYPWQFVLHQLTDANLASAQAALDQADKTTEAYQNAFIAEVTSIIDVSIIREAHARGKIGLPASFDLARLLVGSHDRPRRADANRLRTRQAAGLAKDLGVSLSTIFAEMGYSYADEVKRRKQDHDLASEIIGEDQPNDAEDATDEDAADQTDQTPDQAPDAVTDASVSGDPQISTPEPSSR